MSASECISLLTPLIQSWETANSSTSRWSSAFIPTIQTTLLYLSLIEKTDQETNSFRSLQGRADWLYQQDFLRVNPLIFAHAAPSTPRSTTSGAPHTPPSLSSVGVNTPRSV